MRQKVTIELLRAFMRELADGARSPGKVYFTGGATALMYGFREQTIDVNIRLDPEPAGVFEAIAHLKDALQINVELASPIDFVPPLPDWREKSPRIDSVGVLTFYHFDLRLQALAKIERNHAQDATDVNMMLRKGLVTRTALIDAFRTIEGELIRYPAIHIPEFKQRVMRVVDEKGGST